MLKLKSNTHLISVMFLLQMQCSAQLLQIQRYR